ncbi:AAA family ATPase [Entomospira entomophila]|uniref:AAA family ATPase n=1 Tax=Entomospira entomophila TaxID=2719988 RepID=A0A968KWP5_9SPIO|nr:AAA family ATPase [Entomospira entomophilus]NIZ41010.1 AAA family ATPase [Entomospira entomophilus]WDI35223.1 AAA family ATPase [Entomospira entomophilus]
MKIESVRIKNLASLEGEWFIPFNESCYEDSGIFLITGRTGSGKSTILDAICFALYQTTPRLHGSDIGQLITKSQNYGSAEVIFSVNGVRYRSICEYYKAGKKGRSKTSITEVHLENLVTGELLVDNPSAGIKEHGNRIYTITGMNFAQFKQSILLAQGEFSSFLLAKADKRAEILERLTDSTIYTKISQKVYDSFAQERNEIDQVQRDLSKLDDKELSDRSEDLVKLRNEKFSIDKKLQVAREEKSRIEMVHQKMVRYHDLEATSESRRLQQKEAFNLYEEEKASYEVFLREYQTWQEDMKSTRDRLECGIALQRELLMLEEREKSYLDDGMHLKREIDAIIARSQQLEQDKVRFLQLREEKETLLREMVHLTFTQEHLDSVLQPKGKEFIDSFHQWREFQRNWSKESTQLSWQKYQSAQLYIEQHVNHAEVQAYWHYRFLASQKEVALQQIESLDTQIDQLKEKLHQVSKNLQDKKVSLEIFAQRKLLELGCSCPLCGQTLLTVPESGIDDFHALEAEIQDMESSQKDLTNRIEQLQNERSRCGANIDLLSKQLSEKRELFERYEQSLSSLILEQHRGMEFSVLEEQYQLAEAGVRDLEANRDYLQQNMNLKMQNERLHELSQQLQLLSDELINMFALEISITPSQDDLFALLEEEIQKSLSHWRAYFTQKSVRERKLKELESEINRIDVDLIRDQNSQKHYESKLTENCVELNDVSEAMRINVEQLIAMDLYQRDISRLELELKAKDDDYEKTNRKHKEELRELEYQQKVLADELNKLQEELMHIQTYLIEQNVDMNNLVILVDKMSMEIHQYEEKIQVIENEREEKSHVLSQVVLLQEQFEAHLVEQKQIQERLAKKQTDFHYLQQLAGLIGSRDGKKFKTFAQAITLDQVVVLANQFLGHMQDRYILQREIVQPDKEETLNFVIIDQFQADEIRSIQTLSGGERFLVSLALAMGLAGLASEKVQVESFFLDEGFGTLDADALEVVLDALTRLRDIRKTVGIISHVDLLKERITHQIQVVQMGGGRSKVIGEGIYGNKQAKELL